MAIIDFLEKVDVFKNMDDAQLEAIQNCSHLSEFKRGDRLFAKGEEATHLWIVKKGEVDLRLELPDTFDSQDNTISFISQAQAFGWSCFAPPYEYRLSGYCASRTCEVVRMEKQSLVDLFEKNPDIGYQVMFYLVTTVGKQFHQYQDEIAKRLGKDIMTRW